MLPVPLDEITRVEFFKRDELTTDLICCEINAGDRVHLIHEEMEGWAGQVAALVTLPRFDREWFEKVSQPPFAESRTIAFQR